MFLCACCLLSEFLCRTLHGYVPARTSSALAGPHAIFGNAFIPSYCWTVGETSQTLSSFILSMACSSTAMISQRRPILRLYPLLCKCPGICYIARCAHIRPQPDTRSCGTCPITRTASGKLCPLWLINLLSLDSTGLVGVAINTSRLSL